MGKKRGKEKIVREKGEGTRGDGDGRGSKMLGVYAGLLK